MSENPFAPFVTKHDRQVKSSWSCETVANLLFEQVPQTDRIPGSPILRLEIEDNMVVLRQSTAREE